MTTDLASTRSHHCSTVVVVLGAGRSGTRALTRGLQALGVDRGAKLRNPLAVARSRARLNPQRGRQDSRDLRDR